MKKTITIDCEVTCVCYSGLALHGPADMFMVIKN